MDSYLIPAALAEDFFRYEQNIKQSHFIASFAHAASTEDAKMFIEKIKAEFNDATHNCWAFKACPPNQSSFIGYSDDGEPHGTAGRPMLNSLLYSNIGEIVVVVTRYFGGVKLGTGGLVRAYQGIVDQGLRIMPTKMFTLTIFKEIIIDYDRITLFLRLADNYEARIINSNFSADATYQLELPESKATDFEQAITSLTDGRVLISNLDSLTNYG